MRRRYVALWTTGALVVRLAVTVYGEWHDSQRPLVRYTDIDYHVFTDGAQFLAEGKSPYMRATYRYTPLLGYLVMLANHYSRIGGKLFFVACDMLCGLLIYAIVSNSNKPRRAAEAMLIWLWNPMIMAISTRGNAESFICLLTLATGYLLQLGHVVLGGAMLATAIHFKIYPIIYLIPSLARMLWDPEKFFTIKWSQLSRAIRFSLAVTAVFFALTGWMFGQEFLEHTYLYHISRRDHRHNFSLYYFNLYLNFDQSSDLIASLAFVPQACLVLWMGLWYSQDWFLSAFFQTFVFVTFNKYFLWFLCFFPIVYVRSNIKVMWTGVLMLVLWFGGQAFWLYQAFNLEIVGKYYFVWIWVGGIVFFLCNALVCLMFMLHLS